MVGCMIFKLNKTVPQLPPLAYPPFSPFVCAEALFEGRVGIGLIKDARQLNYHVVHDKNMVSCRIPILYDHFSGMAAPLLTAQHLCARVICVCGCGDHLKWG